jgi:hypothetical protein
MHSRADFDCGRRERSNRPVYGNRECRPGYLLLTVEVRSFGRLLDLLRTSALRRLGHRRRLVVSDLGWPRDPALVVGGQLQQAPLDQWISSLGEGPDCPCPSSAKLVVHIRPRKLEHHGRKCRAAGSSHVWARSQIRTHRLVPRERRITLR